MQLGFRAQSSGEKLGPETEIVGRTQKRWPLKPRAWLKMGKTTVSGRGPEALGK